MDYPMDNHRVPFREMRKILRTHSVKSLGFGGSVMLFMLIPGVNLVVMPASVVAATVLWHELNSTAR